MLDKQTKSPPGGSVLVVDDDPYIRESLQDFLVSTGSNVVLACDGVEALNIFDTAPVDAIITDVQMPYKSGLELVAELRANYHQTPVVLITAYPDRDKVKEALRLDVTDFIEKPFKMEQILTVTKRAIAFGQALRRQNAQIEGECQKDTALPADAQRRRLVKRITAGMKLSYQYYSRP